MTLIALHAEEQRATIMTDSWGYTFGLAMSATSKHVVLPHFDMAMVAQGSTGFQARWFATLLMLSEQSASFDDLLHVAPSLLRATWADMSHDVDAENEQAGARAAIAKSVIFHVGYSPARGRFVAIAYASERDFEPIDLSDVPYVQPTPLSNRPGPVEGPRLIRHFASAGIPLDALDELERMPALQAPQSEAEWVDLALRVRADRSESADLFGGFKTYVGGDVHLTTLAVGAAETRRVHRYADDNETLRRIFAGSLHPLSQLGACALCDSGKPFVECCLADTYNGRPCPCGGPDNFEVCCSALADQGRTRAEHQARV